MEMEGLDEVYRLQRFLPTPQEAVGYFLPHLLAGETMHGAEKLIHRTDVYAREPKDLAADHPPVPTAVSTGDRFFFTPCKRKNGRCTQRGAGAGSWTVQKTEDIYDAEKKIGEVRNLSFKKGKDKASTGWVMEEYRCLLPQAVVADGEMVLCRIHLAHNPPAAARQESNAYKLRRQEEGPEPAPAPQPAEPVTVTAHKRPAPVAAAADMSRCKKMRIAAPVPVPEPEAEYEDCPMWPATVAAADPPCSNKTWTSVPAPAPASYEEEYEDYPVWSPAAPVSSPASSTEAPEADDDTGRLSCTVEELLGEVQQEEQNLSIEAENNIEHHLDLAVDQDREQPAAPINWESLDLQSILPDDWESEVQREEQTTRPIEAHNNIQQLVSDQDIDIDQIAASVDWEFLLGYLREDEAELVKKRCRTSLEGRSQFISSTPVN